MSRNKRVQSWLQEKVVVSIANLPFHNNCAEGLYNLIIEILLGLKVMHNIIIICLDIKNELRGPKPF